MIRGMATMMRQSTAAAVVLTACDNMTGGVPHVAGAHAGPVVPRFPALRAASQTPERRSEIAGKATAARWGGRSDGAEPASGA